MQDVKKRLAEIEATIHDRGARAEKAASLLRQADRARVPDVDDTHLALCITPNALIVGANQPLPGLGGMLLEECRPEVEALLSKVREISLQKAEAILADLERS